MEISVIENIESFPLLLELCEILDNVIAFSGTFPKQIALDGNGNLIVLCLVYGFETFPDLMSSIEMCDMHHLVLGDIVGNQDLHIHIVGIPDVVESLVESWIRSSYSAIDIWLDTTEMEDAVDSFAPDNPIRVVKGFFHLGDAQRMHMCEFLHVNVQKGLRPV